MNAERLKSWWLSPPRAGIRRFISPWEYRHLRAFGITRVVGGCVAAAAGVTCLAYRAYGWTAFFLVVAALSFAAAWWFFSIVRSLGNGRRAA